MAKYYLQEMPDMDKGGKRRVYPKIQTNRQISTKELAEKIQKRSGVFKEGLVNGVLTTLADTLVDYLSMGYSVKIDGLGALSLSLEFTDEKPTVLTEEDKKMGYRHVRVKDVNFKSDKELIKRIRINTELERAASGVNEIGRSKFSPAERLSRALAYIEKNGSISLYEYSSLNGMSRSSASRELNALARKPESGIAANGSAPHKTWVKRKADNGQTV